MGSLGINRIGKSRAPTVILQGATTVSQFQRGIAQQQHDHRFLGTNRKAAWVDLKCTVIQFQCPLQALYPLLHRSDTARRAVADMQKSQAAVSSRILGNHAKVVRVCRGGAIENGDRPVGIVESGSDIARNPALKIRHIQIGDRQLNLVFVVLRIQPGQGFPQLH